MPNQLSNEVIENSYKQFREKRKKNISDSSSEEGSQVQNVKDSTLFKVGKQIKKKKPKKRNIK